MKITQLSRVRFMDTADYWKVPRDYFDPLYNYLVYGFEPGSFWCAVLCNDFWRAVQASHPGNTIPALKATVGWMRDRFPKESYGDYERTQRWIQKSDEQRRLALERVQLIYTEQEEIMMGLQGKVARPEPMLFG